jgi:GT2 family glycosyltransferase
VCLPVLNGGKFLLHALQSIESQTYKNIELLISDDGSSDSSISIIEEFKNNSLLEIRVFKNNGFGIAKNCNFLAQKACGKYLKFLFQDDFIDSDFLAKMLLPFTENSNVSLVFCNRHLKLESDSIECLQIYEGCKDLSAKWSRLKSIQKGSDLFEDPLLLEGPINKIGEPSNTIISIEHFHKVGGFSENLKQLLDLELWFKLFTVGKVAYVSKELSTFRIHQQQESHNNLVNDVSSEEAIKLYLSLLTDSLYAQISSNAKFKICKKLTLAEVGDKIDFNVFNRRVLDLRCVIDSKNNIIDSKNNIIDSKNNEIDARNKEINAKITQIVLYNKEIDAKSKEIEAKNKEIDAKTTELTKKLQRISFMENTLVWKFRRLYMKFYYLYKRLFPNKVSNHDNSSLLKFGTYNNLKFTYLPKVKFSIIICYHNNFKETYLCLSSILKKTKGIQYEIILVDDFSDSNPEFLSSINNITYLRNEKNYGFLYSCNKGADVAKGQYFVFLNNDTQVEENWLTSCEPILKKNGTGAIGCKLLYPDGKLQEAGGIIWNDASGCNYGKGDYPKLPEYNFVREVDYCSGASFITPKDVFIQLGGFSKEFEPAYYEDTDYCFRLRASGLKVLYQPDSVVYHHEGLSCGTNLNEGVKEVPGKKCLLFFERNGIFNWYITCRIKVHFRASIKVPITMEIKYLF